MMYRTVGRNAVSSSLVLSLVMNLGIESVTGTQCGSGSSMIICTLGNNKADSY